ncbi:MAG: SLC13 family permease [Prevotella sp.]
MTLVIVVILILAYLLIATEKLTKVNKAAVAVFAGTVGWILYICFGTDYVMSQHSAEYTDFLNGAVPTSMAVKGYIAQNVFLKYVGRAAEIVLFLLATMTIVEILNNNGCFDFIAQLLKTRRSRRLLWALSGSTLIISANLDNLTTTVMMLTMMHKIVPNWRQRLYYGAAIVLAANCGGALTVIGDPLGLVLWSMGHVTATHYSATMAVPCLVAWLLPTWWLGRSLPERVDTYWITMPYRGDDTRLNVWQRLLMLFVGIGGLWFIPTFHSITQLSPFLGAFCVLSVLWVVNEVMNHKLMNVDEMIQRRVPRVLQYGVIQMMLYVMGIMLAVGVVQETGALTWVARQWEMYVHNPWLTGVLAGLVSTSLDSFASGISFVALGDTMGQNCDYWSIIAFTTAVGGNILCVGSMSGMALLKSERMRVGWYFRHVGWKALAGAAVGLVAMYVI